MSEAALLNGAAPDGALARSRGLHYGDGVFRTLLCWRGEPLDWPLHMQALGADCARLQLDSPAQSLLEQEARQLCAGVPAAVLKILCIRKASGRGYAPRQSACDRLLIRDPAPAHPPSSWQTGVAVIRSGVVLGSQPQLAGVKHLNRLEQVLASQAWPEGVAEALMGDGDGHPVCGTRSNLFWVRGGILYTPDLTRCGVAGVMRHKVLLRAAELGLRVITVQASWTQLLEAEEVFLTNSLIGLWPLRQLDQVRFAAPGPLTQRLMDLLDHPRLGT